MPIIEIDPPSYWPELHDCAFKTLLAKALEPLGDDLKIRILHNGAENPDRFFVYVVRKGADGSMRHVYSPSLPALSKDMLERPEIFEAALLEAVQGFIEDIRQNRLKMVQGAADKERETAIVTMSQKMPF